MIDRPPGNPRIAGDVVGHGLQVFIPFSRNWILPTTLPRMAQAAVNGVLAGFAGMEPPGFEAKTVSEVAFFLVKLRHPAEKTYVTHV